MRPYRKNVLVVAVCAVLLMKTQGSLACNGCRIMSVPEKQKFELDCNFVSAPGYCDILSARFSVNPDGSGASTDVSNIMKCKCNCKQTCSTDVSWTKFGDPQHGTLKYLYVEWVRRDKPTYGAYWCEQNRNNNCNAIGTK